MAAAPLPETEPARLRVLRSLEILDTHAEPVFDALTTSAAIACNMPTALLTLVDESRQWFKSAHNFLEKETARDVSFCAHTILGHDIMEIADTWQDERFAGNALVTGEPHIRFYAGVPICVQNGIALGALAVIDHVPRQLTDEQKLILRQLGLIAESLLNERLTHRLSATLGSVLDAAIPEAYLFDLRTCKFVYANRGACTRTGYTLDELLDLDPLALAHAYDPKKLRDIARRMQREDNRPARLETVHFCKDGSRYPVEVAVSFASDRHGPSSDLLVLLPADMTQHEETQRKMAHLGSYDCLTKLGNRYLLEDRIEQAQARATRFHGRVDLFWIDIDDFRMVNDRLGAATGDRLLIEVAQRLLAMLRPTETVARIGGDDFIVLAEGLRSDAEALSLSERLCSAFARPFDVDNAPVDLKASVGAVSDTGGRLGPADFLRHADAEMYKAKLCGRPPGSPDGAAQ